MNKKTVLICALILVVLVVGLLVWKLNTGDKPAVPAAPETEQTGEETTTDVVAENPQEPESSAETTDQETESNEEAILLESEGEIEIIIPEDEETDGF